VIKSEACSGPAFVSTDVINDDGRVLREAVGRVAVLGGIQSGRVSKPAA